MNPRDSMGGTHEGFLRETGNSDNLGHELEVSGVRKVFLYIITWEMFSYLGDPWAASQYTGGRIPRVLARLGRNSQAFIKRRVASVGGLVADGQ